MEPDRYLRAEEGLLAALGVEARVHRLEVASPRTHVRVFEIGEGPPVLCVHGSPNTAVTWVQLAKAAPGHRWLLLERPGAGLSGRTEWGVHRRDVVALVETVLDALDAPRVDVVGSSFGGLYAYYLALDAPGRVRRMVQMGCPAGPTLVSVPPIFRGIALPGFPTLMRHGMKTDVASARDMWRQIGHGATLDRGGLPDVVFEWYSTLLGDTPTMEGLVDEVRAIATPFGYRGGVAIGEADLARIAAPTLYLWGDADTFATPAQGERLAAATPGAAIERFPDSGHLPWMDDPARIAARVTAFLGHGAG